MMNSNFTKFGDVIKKSCEPTYAIFTIIFFEVVTLPIIVLSLKSIGYLYYILDIKFQPLHSFTTPKKAHSG